MEPLQLLHDEGTFEFEREPCPKCGHPLSLSLPSAQVPVGTLCPNCGCELMLLKDQKSRRLALRGYLAKHMVLVWGSTLLLAAIFLAISLSQGASFPFLWAYFLGLILFLNLCFYPLTRAFIGVLRHAPLIFRSHPSFFPLPALRDETPDPASALLDLTQRRCFHCGELLALTLPHQMACNGFDCPHCQKGMRFIPSKPRRLIAAAGAIATPLVLLVIVGVACLSLVWFIAQGTLWMVPVVVIGCALFLAVVSISPNATWRYIKHAVKRDGLLPAARPRDVSAATYVLGEVVRPRPIRLLRSSESPLDGAVSLSDDAQRASSRGALSPATERAGLLTPADEPT